MQVRHLLLIAILALTAACSSTKEVVDENLSEVELYQQAQADLDNHSYTSATAKLKALESRYPFGRYADQAQLELIYAYYKNSEPEAAKSAAERFIRLHPQHPNVDYAYYLKGLTSFDQDVGLLARFLPLDMSKRDPGAARDSYNEFAQLTSRYPNSRYAPDAKARMIYLRNLLAAYEIHAGRYYLTRQAYVAAANRGRYVVENLQETPSVGDGLALMVLSAVLSGYDGARLERALSQGPERVADSAGSSAMVTGRGPSLFLLSGVPAQGKTAQQVEDALRAEVARVAREGVSEAELSRVKTQWIASTVYQRDSVHGQAQDLGSNWVQGLPLDAEERLLALLRTVTPEQVQQVAARYFGDDQLTVATLLPQPLDAKARRAAPAAGATRH